MKKILLITLLFIAVSQWFGSSFAQERNFPVVKSQYFSVYGYEGLDIKELLSKLNFKYFLQTGNLSSETNQDPESILIKTMDALYLEISDILGIHIYSFHGNIKFFPDQGSLSAVFRSDFQEDFAERSFYRHEKNTIYISYPDLTLGMIGHEISHAIQSHYFVVPPPAKVQEILSGYVEYSLRKTMQMVP